ncbi:hypothetical protein L873DRAFT_1828234 [Choiromyces venosus 120613-1]|uniref:BTB domain-containing protein n=1 Tax=Choiromyces venosus 120613-1 TaxID=1336337 RepID=A0A3N4JLR4_9PEZI|nr:hypothetical protein L873DRAFT_1828234 [Choiromyces venosus 120613-1]
MLTRPEDLSNPSKTTLFNHLLQDRSEIRAKNPLDESEAFQRLCEACRCGDIKTVQNLIAFEGVNLNAVDRFDNLPLTLASLCGHYEVVELLLESGAVCERDTFQGERILHNALNNKIRNLLVRYDYSKSVDPAQPWAAHITSLLSREPLDTTDIVITATTSTGLQTAFHLHRFMLSARSPYFRRKLALPSSTPTTPTATEHKSKKTIRLSQNFCARAFETAVKYIYLGEVSADPNADEEVMANIEKLSRHLEIPELWEFLLADTPKLRRQLRSEGLKKAQEGMEGWVRENVLNKKIVVRKSQVGEVKIFPGNDGFADVLIRSDEPDWHDAEDPETESQAAEEEEEEEEDYLVHIYPTHKSLLRSEFFTTMFTSPFLEGRPLATPHSPLPIIPLPLPASTLPYLLLHLYLETPTPPPLKHSLSLLYTSDILLLDRLKSKCAQVIATAAADLPFHIHDVLRAAWATRVPRLEAFAAKYIADRLEDFLPDPDFAELVAESAGRIEGRQETDTIELVDDVRYYLNERFRMRVEDNLGFLGNGEAQEGEEGGVDRSLETEKGYVYDALLGKIDELLGGLRLDA